MSEAPLGCGRVAAEGRSVSMLTPAPTDFRLTRADVLPKAMTWANASGIR